VAALTQKIAQLPFGARYGSWAVIAGASDGTGAEFARQLAARGLNILLIARRLAPLEELAAKLRSAFGIEARLASIDLFQAGAGLRVVEAAAGLDVGLFVSNAGGDANGSTFLKAPLRAWEDLIHRNVLALAQAVHGFAGPMVARGRGGFIIMSSGAALGGQPGTAIYSGTKAFDLNFAESIWSELRGHGVDVICGVCGAMDTPSLHALLDKRGLTVPGLLQPGDVVRELLERLPAGPLYVTPFGPQSDQAPIIEQARRDRMRQMEHVAKMFFGDLEDH
jgi:short-subunit dehydrogenase